MQKRIGSCLVDQFGRVALYGALAIAPIVAGCGGGDDSTIATTDGGDEGSTDTDATGGSVCGNGALEPGEECDDGNTTSGDGCDNACTFTCVQGDPKRDMCNDGNACNGTESCGADHKCAAGTPLGNGQSCGMGKTCVMGNCTPSSCGDGIVQSGEECDDGNATNGDGCDNTCRFSCLSSDTTRSCKSTSACVGDGTCNDTTHVCAPGQPTKDGTSCGSSLICIKGGCVSVQCGDGIVSAGEQCDFGAGKNTTGSGCEPTCQFSCTATPTNSCDDKNPCNGQETCNQVQGPNSTTGQKCAAGTPEADGTACGTNMTCKGGNCTTALCGNGTIDAGEQCDLGAANGTKQGCNAQCQFDCQTATDCNDNNVCDGTESCVQGSVSGQNVQKCAAGTNAAKCSTCTNGLCNGAGTCAASTCGDGCVDASKGETCDPPNGSTCDAQCHTVAQCGNGVLEGTEQCDDHNFYNLDGCDSNCKYEAIARMTQVQIAGTAAPSFCTPSTNRLGTQSLTSTALSNINGTLSTDVQNGTTNVLTYFMGLDDLTGVSDPNGFTLGIVSGKPDPAKGVWPSSGNPEDWWFLAAHSTITNGLPNGILGNGKLAARNMTAGPSDVALQLILGGSPALLEMRAAQIAARIDGTPAPNTPAPPPATLANGLVVFQTITGNGTGQGLCGNITVESLAQIPIPQALTTGATACSASCSNSKAYTYCGMGMPVSASCNSLLDALVGGCKAAFCLVDVIDPQQPDVPIGATVTPLSLGANNKVPSSQSTGNKDAYSSYMTFTANRAHLTGEDCATNSDCQTNKTCTNGTCQ